MGVERLSEAIGWTPNHTGFVSKEEQVAKRKRTLAKHTQGTDERTARSELRKRIDERRRAEGKPPLRRRNSV